MARAIGACASFPSMRARSHGRITTAQPLGRENVIGDDGAKWPAPPIPSTLKLSTVVLTKLDFEYNFMRYARGKQAVRDAVKDRSGFVLHLSMHGYMV